MRVWLVLVAACGGGGHARLPDAPVPIAPTANPARDVRDTQLAFDALALTATATITFAPSDAPGATLETGDLVISSVSWLGQDLPFMVTDTSTDFGLPASANPQAITIAYAYKHHDNFDGASSTGFTFIWPYYCSHLFPCHSQPTDGTTFSLDVTNVVNTRTAIYPDKIPSAAPPYQIAWSIDEYTELDLGTTTAGTMISVWYRPNELPHAMAGTADLVAAFDWFEKTLGPYRFGDHYGSVSVNWPSGGFGGMEHHPRSHIAAASLASEETNVHEAAHGWFGDGIRIQCWEDFVLSEGTVSYLAARALDVVAPMVGAQTWTAYGNELAGVPASDPVWPQSCGQVDVLTGGLFTDAPYMRGAFFYKAVADKVGPDKLDQTLAAFYQAHAGRTGRMSDMLDTIHAVTGYDATSCAQMWLESTTIPALGPCP